MPKLRETPAEKAAALAEKIAAAAVEKAQGFAAAEARAQEYMRTGSIPSSNGTIVRLAPAPEASERNGSADTTPEEPQQEAWPVIDEAAYHGLPGEFVRALDPHTEADPVGILIQFLTAFGSIVGNAPYYLVESDKHHANLFAVLVGDSAKGRKGTGGGRVRAVTEVADEAWFRERTASVFRAARG